MRLPGPVGLAGRASYAALTLPVLMALMLLGWTVSSTARSGSFESPPASEEAPASLAPLASPEWTVEPTAESSQTATIDPAFEAIESTSSFVAAPAFPPTATPDPVGNVATSPIRQAAPRAPASSHLRTGVPILMYHYIRENPVPSDTLGFGLSVTPTDFEAQMAFLKARGYRSVLVGDLASEAARSTSEKLIAITFDDGYADAFLAAYPSLRRHGLQATFYVITGLVGRGNYLTWEQVRALADGGMAIGSHTSSHPDLPRLALAAQSRELTESRVELERRLGKPILDFCYPSGHYDSTVKQAVEKAGYRTAVTVRSGYAGPRDDPLALPRVRVRGGQSLAEFAAALGEPAPGATDARLVASQRPDVSAATTGAK